MKIKCFSSFAILNNFWTSFLKSGFFLLPLELFDFFYESKDVFACIVSGWESKEWRYSVSLELKLSIEEKIGRKGGIEPGEKYWWDFDLAWSLAILEPFWYKSEYSNGSKIARPYGTPDIS